MHGKGKCRALGTTSLVPECLHFHCSLGFWMVFFQCSRKLSVVLGGLISFNQRSGVLFFEGARKCGSATADSRAPSKKERLIAGYISFNVVLFQFKKNKR